MHPCAIWFFLCNCIFILLKMTLSTSVFHPLWKTSIRNFIALWSDPTTRIKRLDYKLKFLLLMLIVSDVCISFARWSWTIRKQLLVIFHKLLSNLVYTSNSDQVIQWLLQWRVLLFNNRVNKFAKVFVIIQVQNFWEDRKFPYLPRSRFFRVNLIIFLELRFYFLTTRIINYKGTYNFSTFKGTTFTVLSD